MQRVSVEPIIYVPVEAADIVGDLLAVPTRRREVSFRINRKERQ
jgi:hypothetical protein